MTRDELIEAMATAEAAFDGRTFLGLYSVEKMRYRGRCAANLASIEAQGLAIVPVVASAELAEKAFPIPPKAHRNACVVRLHEHANKMRREDYDAMIQAGRL